MGDLKIRAIPGKCQGHARCYALAPDIFELNEEGYIAFDEKIIAREHAELAQEGVWACPERALELIEEK